jgi:hypothetical protein
MSEKTFRNKDGWVCRITVTDGAQADAAGVLPMDSFELFKPGPDGKLTFYSVTPGQYGNPMITEEPDGGVAVPSGLTLIDPFGDQVPRPTLKIVGAVFQDQTGKVALDGNGTPLRFSFSNPKAPGLANFGEGGSVEVNGEKWHLVGLHQANKNRLIGLVAFFRRDSRPGGAVVVSELAHVTF